MENQRTNRTQGELREQYEAGFILLALSGPGWSIRFLLSAKARERNTYDW